MNKNQNHKKLMLSKTTIARLTNIMRFNVNGGVQVPTTSKDPNQPGCESYGCSGPLTTCRKRLDSIFNKLSATKKI
jgi:hypothetical protein